MWRTRVDRLALATLALVLALAATVVVLIVTVWLGRSMVYRGGIGVSPHA